MKTVHWSLATGGKVVLPIQFLPFNAFLLSVPSWTSWFSMEGCFALFSKLQSSSEADAVLNQKNCSMRTRALPGFLRCLCPLGEQQIRCNFNFAKGEILTRSQSCQMGNLQCAGKSWGGLDQTQCKLFLRAAKCSFQDMKFLFISYHTHARELGGDSTKISFNTDLKKQIIELEFDIYHQRTVQYSCMQ